MKYCESCRKLYNDNDEKCLECKKTLKTVEDINTPVYLLSAEGFEKDRIITALEDNGIPTDTKCIKHQTSTNAVSGVDASYARILVPYQAYEEAYDICVGIGAIKEEGTEILDEVDFEDKDVKNVDEQFSEMTGGGRAGRIALAVLLLVVFALAIFGTDAIMNFLKKLIYGV